MPLPSVNRAERIVSALSAQLGCRKSAPKGHGFSQPWATPRGDGRDSMVVGPTSQRFAVDERLARWAAAGIS